MDTNSLEWNERPRVVSFHSNRSNPVEISQDTPSLINVKDTHKKQLPRDIIQGQQENVRNIQFTCLPICELKLQICPVVAVRMHPSDCAALLFIL